MTITHRGFEINATRERSLGGPVNIYYSVFRLADGYEVTSGFSEGAEGVRWWVSHLKRIVDTILNAGDPEGYMESSTPETPGAGT